MKCNTRLIAWHNKEPVLSLDFHPSGRLATGGADNTVKVSSSMIDTPLITYLLFEDMEIIRRWNKGYFLK